MSLLEDELPVLNAVVESGNPSIIRSTRLGHEVLRELETLRQDSARRCPRPSNHDASDTHRAPENTSESDKLCARLPVDVAAFDSVTPPTGLPGHPSAEALRSPDSAEVSGGEYKVAPAVAPILEIPEGLDFASLGSTAAASAAANAAVPGHELQNGSTSDEELELMIDDLVDRHITELRQDIKQLLERARRTP